ncbi:MAG: hypothetical protein ACFHWZ_18995 [Phycisphaerales bacterium]
MSSRFAEIDRIFRGALRIEPDGRHDFVVRQCNGDRELLSEVLELLEEDEASVGAGPLDRPALGDGFALSDFAPATAASSQRSPSPSASTASDDCSASVAWASSTRPSSPTRAAPSRSK